LSPIEALLLGLLQGATEFLPVSSSGHLVLAQVLMHVKGSGVGFEVLVHLATLCAILLCLRKDVGGLVRGVLRVFRLLPRGPKVDEDLREERRALAVIAGTVPAVVASLLFGSTVEGAFDRPQWTAGLLLVTGVVLLATRLRGDGARQLGIGIGLLIGIAQAFALFPGISRSGFTIAAAIFLGVPRGEAVRFSFLLAVPAMGGALLYTAVLGQGSFFEMPPLPSAVGFGAAFASGCAAIWVLLKTVKRGRFELFGAYCLLAGVVALALLKGGG
jgi:undecaprenyl-diphosphatase